jgi:hypothetical protein
MRRRPPRATSNEIDLYARTYYSLLRSTGDVRVRAFEEAHSFSNSSLHAGARDAAPDLAAFAYSAARLPACMPQARRLVLGQTIEHFARAGLDVRGWTRVATRGRRRPMRWDGFETLAVFVSSTSDIDDLVPIVTAYQIEWNKMHEALARGGAEALVGGGAEATGELSPEGLRAALGLDEWGASTLIAALGADWRTVAPALAKQPCDLRMRLLYGSFTQYQRSARLWWQEIEHGYRSSPEVHQRPVYFVSSNVHAAVNLLGGYARAHRAQIVDFARATNVEGLAAPLEAALAARDEPLVSNLLYYLLRTFLRQAGQGHADRMAAVRSFDRESGILSCESPGHIDVNAQIIELSRLRADRVDPRLAVPGLEALAGSDAVIINIDYPLGMAAYHHFSRLAEGVGELRGVYVMGKAATLNGRVGDVMIANAVYDEHSKNTYLFRNAFLAADVQPYLRHATVLDNQKAVTVRGAYLQNRDYMRLFYQEGYTVMEMEAGPYLSAVHEAVNPQRHPEDEIVNLAATVPFDLGLLHYASDTPYSRRQSLLSKSLSYFGVESTYGSMIAILRRIFTQEIARLKGA